MPDEEFEEIKRDVKKTAKDIGRGLHHTAKKVEKSLSETNMEAEAIKGIKEIEGLLETLGKSVKKKRVELENKGFERTVSKDAKKAKKVAKKTLKEILEDLEETTRKIREKMDEQ